jgi:hypothetical protein
VIAQSAALAPGDSKSLARRRILQNPLKRLHVWVESHAVPHLVIDTLIVHTVELNIPIERVMQRHPEWIKHVEMSKSRAEYVKGMLWFCGMELVDYDTALIERTKNSYLVHIASAQANLRQPRAART